MIIHTAEVPFKFNIGNQAYSPGQYQFVVAGVNLLTVHDAKAHTIAMLITRSVETGTLSSASKVVFAKHGKHWQLAQIVIENRSDVLEIVGEEAALRRPYSPAPVAPWDVDSLFPRRTAPGFKE